MREFGQILNAYKNSTVFWEDVIYHVETGSHPALAPGLFEELTKDKEINDHAYFALLFFQFEDFVKERFRGLRRTRLTVATRSDRAAWEYIDADRVSLLPMMRMLLPERADLRRKVKQYYDFRNRIAHEAALSLTIVLESAAADLKAIATCIASDAP
ncbi:MAG: hypothetical protein WCJ64_13700 [Rhodospirillaceae bacterium]